MLETKVSQFCKHHQLIKKGARILVGLSGGPDSLALLHFLWSKKEDKQLTIVAAHLDHMFRGEDSYDDLLFVKKYCQELGIPLETKRVNVPKYIEETGKSPQVASRDCRYEFFENVMEKYELSFLALGHHGDDQIETILMRLTRGSTGKARGGIPVSRKFNQGKIIRPFLAVSKDDIKEYCERHNLKPRIDKSNEEHIYLRNRLRMDVLPALKRENSLAHEHFQRFSEEVYEDESFLQSMTEKAMANVVNFEKADKAVLNIADFLAMPNSLQKRGIQLILNYLYKNKPTSLSAIHVEQVISMVKKPQPSGTLHFPLGLYVIRSYNKCLFQFELPKSKDYYFEIGEPGKIFLPQGQEITVQYTSTTEFDINDNKNITFLNPYNITFPLIVRTRKPGDRIVPKGMKGSKKLKSIFIEEKIPINKRDEWPIVTDSNGEILWLPRLKKSSKDIAEEELDNYIVIIIN